MIDITVENGAMTQKEINQYVELLQRQNPDRKLRSLNLTVDGEYVDMKYEFEPVAFNRIRRITGYLVGDMSHWNNAKKAEERDRVKHSCC